MGEKILQLIYYCYPVLNPFSTIYDFAVILFVIFSFLKHKRYRDEFFNALYVFNSLIAWTYLIFLIAYAIELFHTWYGQNSYEWYAFSPEMNSERFIWLFCLSYGSALLFFFKKLRTNRIYIVLFLIVKNFEFIRLRLLRFYSDYLPSSWSTTEESGHQWTNYLLCILMIAGFYYIAHKRKKLPHPSLFLK